MCSQTVDRWGSAFDDTGVLIQNNQCIIPGWNIGEYPTTFSMSRVCDQKVLTFDLVNRAAPSQALGQMYVFKDWEDQLYVTVSINATYPLVKSAGSNLNDYFNGQFLYMQPVAAGVDASVATHAGSMYLWNNLPSNRAPQYIDQMANVGGSRK